MTQNLLHTNQLIVPYGIQKKCFMERCAKCGKYFRGVYELNEHVAIQHNKERWICEEINCSKEYKSKNGYLGHLLKIHNKDIGKHSCSICSKRFLFKSEVSDHCRQVHNSPMLYCKVCNASFKYQSNLSRHYSSCDRDTISPRKLKCSICGKRFAKLQYVRDHIKGQHKPPTYKCQFCEKKFKFRSSLAYHKQKAHKGN